MTPLQTEILSEGIERNLRKFELENYLEQEGILGFCQLEIRYNAWKELQKIAIESRDDYKEDVQQKFKVLKPLFAEALQKYLDQVQDSTSRERLHYKLNPFYKTLQLKVA